MPKIYCVEDDQDIRELIVYALNNSGFDAKGFENGLDFNLGLKDSIPELILLDIMLPGEDGLDILKSLKKDNNTKDIPIIMVTAKISEYDKVKGLDMGADDYITKPFGVMELISRVKAVLRRSGSKDKNKDRDKELRLNGIFLDYNKRLVFVDDNIIDLTYKEFELLYYLLKNQGIVLSRDKIMTEIWGFDFQGETRTVDVHIGTLRQKLGNKSEIIKTVRNVGYKVGDI